MKKLFKLATLLVVAVLLTTVLFTNTSCNSKSKEIADSLRFERMLRNVTNPTFNNKDVVMSYLMLQKKKMESDSIIKSIPTSQLPTVIDVLLKRKSSFTKEELADEWTHYKQVYKNLPVYEKNTPKDTAKVKVTEDTIINNKLFRLIKTEEAKDE